MGDTKPSRGNSKLRQTSGKSYIDVESDSLQKQLANFSSSDRSMSVCRDVMIKLMRPGDSILQQSPIGKSATLAIRYMV